MKAITPILLACAMLCFAANSHAGQGLERDAQAIHQARVQQSLHVSQRHAAQQKQHALTGLGDGYGGSNGPYANPYREYPPSCMADPLPTVPSGPVYSKIITLAAYNYEYGWAREDVEVMIWRVPCSSSGNHPNAITLMRIRRADSLDGNFVQYAAFPGLSVAQGSVGFDDPDNYDQPRVAEEPNTIVAWTPVDASIFFSTTYVLEAWPLPEAPLFDYTQAFQIRFDNYLPDGPRQFIINVPAYRQSNYADATKPLPINGYMSSAYYDPAHSGEGMAIQVYETPGNGSYMLSFNWYTFGPDGKPFWITGTAGVQPGARTAMASEVGYADNGGFAGNFGDSADRHPWGSVSFEWPDCNRVIIHFQSRDDLPDDVPQGSGTRHWSRIANVNGLTCE